MSFLSDYESRMYLRFKDTKVCKDTMQGIEMTQILTQTNLIEDLRLRQNSKQVQFHTRRVENTAVENQ